MDQVLKRMQELFMSPLWPALWEAVPVNVAWRGCEADAPCSHCVTCGKQAQTPLVNEYKAFRFTLLWPVCRVSNVRAMSSCRIAAALTHQATRVHVATVHKRGRIGQQVQWDALNSRWMRSICKLIIAAIRRIVYGMAHKTPSSVSAFPRAVHHYCQHRRE